MATIRLKRTSEFNNRFVDVKIFIDGQQVGKITNGETNDFPTAAGQHIITAKIDWCSSPDISVDVNNNQIKTLKVSGFRNGQVLLPIGLGIIVLHFVLSKYVDFDYTLFLIVPWFLIILYHFTIGRKKYLTIEEINDN